MEPFKYPDLPSEDYIRIIELLPGEPADEIKFNLTVELRTHCKESYDAISYVWGDKRKLRSIVCCNKAMKITENLYSALETIRAKHPGKSTRLWADAISIDQENIQEKNHQVKNMGLVYRNAGLVHIWLGADSDGIAKDTFRLVQEYNTLLHLPKLFSPGPDTSTVDELSAYLLEVNKLGPLLRLPWFKRVWVVQEVALARNARLHWGQASLDFAEIVELACYYSRNPHVTKWLGGPNDELLFLRLLFQCVYRTYGRTALWGDPQLKWFFKGPKGPSKHAVHSGLFLDILIISKVLLASDARDHIYAFLGNLLARDDRGKLLIEPDYGKTEQQISLDLTEALLQCTREAPYVLCFVQHSSVDDVTGASGPSWLHNWNNDGTDRKLIFTIGNIGLNYEAGGRVDSLQFKIQENRILLTPGLIFDELCWTSEILKSGDLALDLNGQDENSVQPQQPYIQVLLDEVTLAYQQYRGAERTWDPVQHKNDFSYTLVTGYNNKEDISQKSHASIFNAYCHFLEIRRAEPQLPADYVMSSKQAKKARRFERDTQNCDGRRLGILKSGKLALIPKFAQNGDACAILAGMATPFILRRADANLHGEGYHHLVGEAYVRGVMRGELAVNLDEVKMDIRLI
ncbi:heterokaryon incompatibility protein-domain-containing protein [Paraphoma chrysanthemicola]|uniref:Heterokaryon incompatibility protein-domain-containing protein n=1 Tax=Paraphoma chrysanthemicola TaxID=798071 RepID=A0A8K0W250_9PLEO|nr:heterokaryon incompatibility protein-domain-containing protein [Paraphoma chrysanthemicola]